MNTKQLGFSTTVTVNEDSQMLQFPTAIKLEKGKTYRVTIMEETQPKPETEPESIICFEGMHEECVGCTCSCHAAPKNQEHKHGCCPIRYDITGLDDCCICVPHEHCTYKNQEPEGVEEIKITETLSFRKMFPFPVDTEFKVGGHRWFPIAFDKWIDGCVERVTATAQRKAIEKVRSMLPEKKVVKKVNGMLPLRAEENRNGFNEALQEVDDIINTLYP